MKLSLIYPDFLLQHRLPGLDFANMWTDPRGLTGSEVGLARIAEELAALGHDVTIYTMALDRQFGAVKIRPIEEMNRDPVDATVSFNDPRPLENAKGLRVCPMWLNSCEFAGPGKFWEWTDLWLSPAQGHLDYFLSKPHEVWNPGTADQLEPFVADARNWEIMELGCDPERYGLPGAEKVPGRVIYCSSPDRGLHWLLQEWPRIRRAVPHATLKIFYRLKPWLDQWHAMPYAPSTASLRRRAVYIEEALRRIQSAGGMGISLCDAVSRREIERQQSMAEVLAYPCDPSNAFTEGFSCSTLECCAARACPIITDVDAFPKLYGGTLPLVHRGDWRAFGDAVIEHLTNETKRAAVNERAAAFAGERTWRKTAKRLEQSILGRLKWAPASHCPPRS